MFRKCVVFLIVMCSGQALGMYCEDSLMGKTPVNMRHHKATELRQFGDLFIMSNSELDYSIKLMHRHGTWFAVEISGKIIPNLKQISDDGEGLGFGLIVFQGSLIDGI